MLRIYGDKIDLETGEVIEERALIFHAISNIDWVNRGMRMATDAGYSITEIWRIGDLTSRFADVRVY